MKNNTALNITFSAIKLLDNFLRDQNQDINIVKAHGFLTAIISLPEPFLADDWLPLLVGDLNRLAPSMSLAVSEGLTNLYQQILTNLNSEQEFKFLLSADNPNRLLKHSPLSSIQDWCKGYCLALVWRDNEWLYSEKDYISNACVTFFALANLIGDSSEINQKQLINNLAEIVKSLYIYWLGSHINHSSSSIVLH